jgi:hypothetical protein
LVVCAVAASRSAALSAFAHAPRKRSTLRQPSRGLKRRVQQHIVVACAWIGLDRGKPRDDRHRTRSQMKTPGRTSR